MASSGQTSVAYECDVTNLGRTGGVFAARRRRRLTRLRLSLRIEHDVVVIDVEGVRRGVPRVEAEAEVHESADQAAGDAVEVDVAERAVTEHLQRRP